MKKRKLIRPLFNIFIAAIFIVIIIFIIRAFFNISENNTTEHKTILLDEYTRIDSIHYEKENITYYLTVNFQNISLDTLVIKQKLRTNLIEDIKKNHKYKLWKQKKINFRYIYMNEKREKIFSELITHKMY